MRPLLLLLLSAVGCLGQSGVVYQTLKVYGTGTFFDTPNVNSVGQLGHLALVVFSNAPGGTCTAPNGVGYFQGSFDGVNYVRFGANSASNQGNFINLPNLAGFVAATGSFPYVRFHLLWSGSSAPGFCYASVFYSGSVYQSTATQVQGLVPGGSPGYGSVNPVLVGAASSAGFIRPLPLCESVRSVSLVPGGFINIAGFALPSTTELVCGIFLAGDAAGTSIRWYYNDAASPTGTCSTGVNTAIAAPLTIGTGTVTAGGGVSPVFAYTSTAGVGALCLGAATGNVTGWVTYASMIP